LNAVRTSQTQLILYLRELLLLLQREALVRYFYQPENMRRISRCGHLGYYYFYYCIVIVFTIIVVVSEATASTRSDRRFHSSSSSTTTAASVHWHGPLSGTTVIKSSQQHHRSFVFLATSTTPSARSKTLLKIRGGGGGTAAGGGSLAALLQGNDAMQVAVASATAVSVLHGCIDILFPSAVCRFYNVPAATSSPGMEEILIRRIGALLLATGLVAVAVFFSSSSNQHLSMMGGRVSLPLLLPQTLDHAVALTTLVFWLESMYRLVQRLPTKMEFDATATWTNLFVNSVFLGIYLDAFLRQQQGTSSPTTHTAVLAVTKWILRIVLAHGILGVVAPSAVLALGGFPPPRKNQDLAVVLGITRAAGYWALAFAIFAMSVQNSVRLDNGDALTMTLHHLRGFAYSRLVILFRSLYMNFASREVYTSLRLKQVFWLVFDFLVAAVLSQSFFWHLAFA
jgi:hypothetical protein